MAWEENSCICLNMQLIAILSRIGVVTVGFWPNVCAVADSANANNPANSKFLCIVFVI